MTERTIKRVYLFRHGETDWNRERRLQGNTDIPLNEEGREQARCLAAFLSSHPIEIVVSSDLKRALDTGRAVAEALGVPLEIEPRLRETNLGHAEGLTVDDVIARLGAEAWRRWASILDQDADFAFPAGESKRAHLRRVLGAMEDRLRATRAETVAVSSHGGVLRRVLHHVLPGLSEPVSVPNCAVYLLEFDTVSGKWSAGSAAPVNAAELSGAGGAGVFDQVKSTGSR